MDYYLTAAGWLRYHNRPPEAAYNIQHTTFNISTAAWRETLARKKGRRKVFFIDPASVQRFRHSRRESFAERFKSSKFKVRSPVWFWLRMYDSIWQHNFHTVLRTCGGYLFTLSTLFTTILLSRGFAWNPTLEHRNPGNSTHSCRSNFFLLNFYFLLNTFYTISKFLPQNLPHTPSFRILGFHSRISIFK